jgi:K+-transporting ATPase A subunit
LQADDRRTPELFGRKIEAGEIKLLAVVILIQPIDSWFNCNNCIFP